MTTLFVAGASVLGLVSLFRAALEKYRIEGHRLDGVLEDFRRASPVREPHMTEFKTNK